MNEYVNMENQKAAAIKTMSDKSQTAYEAVVAHLTAQQKKLAEHIDQQNIQKVKDRYVKIELCEKLKEDLLQSRRREKDFIIREDNKHINNVNDITAGILSEAKELRLLHTGADDHERVDNIINSTTVYKNAFSQYVTLFNSQKTQGDNMQSAAHSLMEAGENLHTEMQTEMNSLASNLSTTIILLIIAGLISGTLLAFFFFMTYCQTGYQNNTGT